MKLREASIGIFVILTIVFFIFPLPAGLLDFLIVINITIALLILLSAIYATEPLDMSTFPTILLITTLFRVSINVSSTRLMLGQGYAGEVINTFGEFVAGGNMVVGIIIFVIMVIVNMMVITKGSERVAEVTARFTLDAMPGKQMAIDADLNSGLIGEEEAKERRAKIQAESNFFGAMDGATKFVKGDANAGIVITLINIIGGIVLGTTAMDMDMGEAANLFTLMAIGDGLVSQIPAILISTATGILVTKANTDNDSSLGENLNKQLLHNSLVLMIAGGAIAFLGVATPLPTFIFVPFGAGLFAYGMLRRETLCSR